MSKHTPGPWRLGSSARIIMAGMGRRIASVPMYGGNESETDENAANALLIAAAPDLLLACKAALAKLNHAPLDKISVAADMLRAAIAKAEGEQ